MAGYGPDRTVTAVHRSADGTLSAPDTLQVDGGGDALGQYPAVAFDRTGRATIAYTTNPSSGNDAVFRAERPAGAGATFGAAQQIVAPDDPEAGPDTDVGSIRAETNRTGDVVVAWVTRKTGGSDSALAAAVRDETGLWGDVQELHTKTAGAAGAIHVRVKLTTAGRKTLKRSKRLRLTSERRSRGRAPR